MRSSILAFVSGVWLLQQQAVLPGMRWAWLLLALLPVLWLPRRVPWRRITRALLLTVLAAACGFFYAAWVAQQRLADELPAAWQGKDIEVVGVVAEMPRQHERGLSFAFDVERVTTQDVHVPHHLLLSTYINEEDEALALHAGERWQLTVRLKQPHGTSNPHNFDFEAWALERNLRAAGYVHGKGDNRRLDEWVVAPGYFIEQMREAVREHFQRTLGAAPYTGVLSALAIGDQGSIPAAQWQVFTRTGVNHLMSISGLHITMLAGLAFALTYALWRRSVHLTLRLPARKAAAVAGLLVALAYTLLSGYSVPAQRTVYMLATIAAALWLSRTVAASQILAAALLVVLLLDPWAVLSPGFWLSFGAVALIFYVTAHRLRQQHWLIEYGRVQWAMMIGLIPPLLALFQQVSLVSPIANAFAIPLVEFVVVPLTLLGALLPFDWILHLAHQSMRVCMVALEWLNQLPDAVWTQHAPPAWSIALGMLGALWCLLPRGFPARWLGLIVMLPMFLVLPPAPLPGTLHLIIFDVGQGMAVAAQTHDHALLYDTGPDFNGEADSGNRILVPSLRAQGIARLDGLMLTHDDTDHTGGALSVIQAMPVGWLSSSLSGDSPILHAFLPSPSGAAEGSLSSSGAPTGVLLAGVGAGGKAGGGGLIRCADGQNWDWDGVRFEVLHPSRASYAEEKISKNNRGCVLRISAGKHSVLLAADIEKDSEWRLLKQHADKLPATLLLVPHHGSKTSSIEPFVEAVHPRYTVFAAGYRNRFGHPKEEVVERYRAAGSELLRSDEDGAIIVNMDAQDFSVERYRKSHARYWQQP
ncbi:MAG: DNA internalization-related competence protein ComEC/Rec2, partial [Gallionellaceae bacterium]|nr:DNA internalization-related competence protein ComEC/Rec2 [Gallionellaceae bacterium]